MCSVTTCLGQFVNFITKSPFNKNKIANYLKLICFIESLIFIIIISIITIIIIYYLFV